VCAEFDGVDERSDPDVGLIYVVDVRRSRGRTKLRDGAGDGGLRV
jgi:hypothetical protein